MPRKYQIHIASDILPYPEAHEVSDGAIIAKHLQADVTFIKRHTNAKSPDFRVGTTIWELKSPTGNGKRTIQNNLRNADDQSANIILDLRRIKMHANQAESRINYELSKANKIKRLLVITKRGRVLDLK